MSNEEIPMYCCLYFSYAAHYGFITIDTESISVEIQIKSSLSDAQKNEIWDNLRKQHISNISADYFEIRHCPWCGVHLSTVIDFDKGAHAGQYSGRDRQKRIYDGMSYLCDKEP